MPVTCVLRFWLEAWLRGLQSWPIRPVRLRHRTHRGLAIGKSPEQHFAATLRDEVAHHTASGVVDYFADALMARVDAHGAGIGSDHHAPCFVTVAARSAIHLLISPSRKNLRACFPDLPILIGRGNLSAR